MALFDIKNYSNCLNKLNIPSIALNFVFRPVDKHLDVVFLVPTRNMISVVTWRWLYLKHNKIVKYLLQNVQQLTIY